jgi:RNA polymerase sigma-70 factor (ECF subfamily)
VDLTETTVADAKAGNSDAVSTIYRSLAPKVVGYLKARGAEDPEGLTNEVFIAVIPRLTRLEGGAAGLRTLVFSVAHARYVDETRRRSRRPRQTTYEQEYDDRTAPSAETTAIELTGSARMIGLLDHLGDDQRSVISLRILGDLSLEQTADVLGKTTGAIKQLQRRGLENLRNLIEQDRSRGGR